MDPHIWMDIELWSYAVDVIVQYLNGLDAVHSSFYKAQGDALKEKMLRLHKKIRQEFQEIDSTRRYLVTSHDAFQYFTRAYLREEGEKDMDWQKRVSAPEGLAPEGEISPCDIKKVIAFLSAYQISVIFPESNVSKSSLQKIAHDAEKLGLIIRVAQDELYGDTMPEIRPGEIAYLKMIPP